MKTNEDVMGEGDLFVTGDTHGMLSAYKLNRINFPVSFDQLTKRNVVLIAGDVWAAGNDEVSQFFEALPMTVAYADGNHEDHSALQKLPVCKRFGGRVHIDPRYPSVIHLMRGETYTICGFKVFAMGGATSIDKAYRVEGEDLWSDLEVPSKEEYETAESSLAAHDYDIDLVVSHSAPADKHKDIAAFMARRGLSFSPKPADEVSLWLQDLGTKLREGYAHACGHFHIDTKLDDSCVYMVYNDIYWVVREQSGQVALEKIESRRFRKDASSAELPDSNMVDMPKGWHRLCRGFASEVSELFEEFETPLESIAFADANGALTATMAPEFPLLGRHQIDLAVMSLEQGSQEICRICGTRGQVGCYTDGQGQGGFFCPRCAPPGYKT